MLELALELREAINRYAAIDKRYKLCPTEQDWDNVNALIGYLKVFYDDTNKLSGTKNPTLNLLFPEFCEVYLSVRKMGSSSYPFIVQMGREMFAKWDKYWTNGNTLLAIACLLDPRCKMTMVEYYFEAMHPEDSVRFIANLKGCLNVLFNEYLEAYSKTTQNQVGSSSRPARDRSSGSSIITDTRAGLKSFFNVKKTSEPTHTQSEVEQYLFEMLDPASLDEDFDILTWWKLKALRYPILARLTRDILVVPISTVASESTFSIAGRTLSPVRSSLNDESLEALICAQDWLRASVNENGGVFGDVIWSTDEAAAPDVVVLVHLEGMILLEFIRKYVLI